MAYKKLTPRQINAARKQEGKPPLNFKLFRKVIKKIETTPEAYDQEVFGRSESRAPCGTAGCIAGWAACLSNQVSLANLRMGPILSTTAGQVLGLYEDEYDLFVAEPSLYWPEPYRYQWGTAKSERGQARVAVRYLTRIITTGRFD